MFDDLIHVLPKKNRIRRLLENDLIRGLLENLIFAVLAFELWMLLLRFPNAL